MTYHICKATRIYDGTPYCGPSSSHVPMEFGTLSVAKDVAERLQKYNPVGWNVFDSETGECVHGNDFFREG